MLTWVFFTFLNIIGGFLLTYLKIFEKHTYSFIQKTHLTQHRFFDVFACMFTPKQHGFYRVKLIFFDVCCSSIIFSLNFDICKIYFVLKNFFLFFLSKNFVKKFSKF